MGSKQHGLALSETLSMDTNQKCSLNKKTIEI